MREAWGLSRYHKLQAGIHARGMGLDSVRRNYASNGCRGRFEKSLKKIIIKERKKREKKKERETRHGRVGNLSTRYMAQGSIGGHMKKKKVRHVKWNTERQVMSSVCSIRVCKCISELVEAAKAEGDKRAAGEEEQPEGCFRNSVDNGSGARDRIRKH